jgi:hypothetical protein
LGERRGQALLFKLATLRTDAALFRTVDALRWRGAKDGFASWAKRMDRRDSHAAGKLHEALL